MSAQRIFGRWSRQAVHTAVVSTLLALVLAACGGEGKRPHSARYGSPSIPDAPGAPSYGGGSSGGSSSGGGTGTVPGTTPVVNLPQPGVIDVTDPGISAYARTLHPVLVENCTRCHGDSGNANPLFVFSDTTLAHHAIMERDWVDLNLPAKSRLVSRLAVDQHACWTTCATDAQTITDAITQWALLQGITPGTVPPPVPKPNDIVSAPTTAAAIIATPAGVGRIANGVVALYEFKNGAGNVASDTSGVAPAADLTFTGTVNWLPTQGVEFTAGSKAAATAAGSRKFFDRFTASNAYTVEAWLAPSSGDTNGVIAAYGQDNANRNFGMSVFQANYEFRHRRGTAAGNAAGNPLLATTTSPAQPSLQHVVFAYDRANGRRIYVNGSKIQTEAGPVALANWNAAYTLSLANEGNNQSPWQGQMKLVAVYDRALSDDEVLQNFDAGIGTTSILSFDISAITGVAGNAITLEFADFDKSAYYFGRPTFIAAAPVTAPIPLQGMRVAVNGKAPVASQAFYSLKTTIDSTSPIPMRLTRQGTIIAKGNGTGDVFTLTFEVLGARQNIQAQPSPTAPPVDNTVVLNVPDAGIRTFEQINNTMAALTGVSPTTPAIVTTFNGIREQLPSAPDIKGFLSSQQTAISRLALDYCDAMVESQPLRDAFFGTNPAFGFTAAPATAFATQTQKDLIINKLVDNMVGVNLANQPTAAELKPAVQTVIDGMLAGCRTTTTINCTNATRTRAIVKASCASVLGSAAVLIQ